MGDRLVDSTAGPAVEARGLVKRYGSHEALRGLDLEVRRGEVFGFIGPNGAGKTTTIRLILDLVRPSAGMLEVLGVPPRSGGAQLRRRLAYLPGDLRLHDRGSVADVIAVFAAMRTSGVAPRRATQARAERLATRLDLDLTRPVRALSKGNRQKVGIVLAFMHDAELLVLDEPTSGLDPLMQQQFLELVREQRDAGRTMLMSSHVLSEVEAVADRIGIIRAGVMVDVDELEAIRARAARVVAVRLPDDATAARLTAELAAVPGVGTLSVAGASVHGTVTGAMGPFLRALGRYDVVDLLSRAPDLEEEFLTYYDAATGGPAGRAGRTGSEQHLQEV